MTRTPPRFDWFLWIALLLVGGVLAVLSVLRYNGYNAGMLDLGNMAQAINSVLHGQPLVVSTGSGPVSRVSGHAELIFFFLAPLYALWPDPRVLVIAQAALFALGGLGAYRLALRRTDSRFAARCTLLIYLLYPVALTGVLFDLHGDTLALPFLMLALDALDEGAWRRYAAWIALALLCKVYVAAAVAGLGVVLFVWQGQRRAGALTFILALAYGLVLFLVVRRLFATPAAGGSDVTGSYITYYFGKLGELGATAGERVLNALVVFGPALFVAWRGWRWLLPAAPIAVAALLTTGPGGAYDFRYHHYAIVAPFVVAATVDGARRLQLAQQGKRRRGRSWSGDLGLTTAIVILCAALLTNIPLSPLFWIGIPPYGFHRTSYGVTARDRLKDRFLAEYVPAQAPLAASNFLAAHLANRATLYLLRYPDESSGPELLPKLLPEVQYAVADALFDFYLPLDDGYAGGVDGDRQAIGLLLRDPQFGLTHMRDGLLLFERNAPAPLQNTLVAQPDDDAPPQARFGGAVELLRSQAEQIGPGRARLQFTWRVTGGFGRERYVAVTRVEGLEGARFVHLPSYALRPAWEWQPGDVLQETFEVELPEGMAAGSYRLLTGWYDVQSPFAEATDQRSRLPGSDEAATATLMIVAGGSSREGKAFP
jgi:uncharacterized membrane protein